MRGAFVNCGNLALAQVLGSLFSRPPIANHVGTPPQQEGLRVFPLQLSPMSSIPNLQWMRETNIDFYPLANVVPPYREREGALGLAPTNRFQKLGNVRAEGRQVISESFNMVALRKFRPW